MPRVENLGCISCDVHARIFITYVQVFILDLEWESIDKRQDLHPREVFFENVASLSAHILRVTRSFEQIGQSHNQPLTFRQLYHQTWRLALGARRLHS
jgi:hypothetical protein